MFSLIITLTAIVLVVGVALVGLYYGGTAFNGATHAAASDQIVNEASQIRAAATLYQNSSPAPLDSLQTLQSANYLSQVPANWYFDTASQTAYTNTADKAACQRYNVQYGYRPDAEPPSCSSLTGKTPVCCGP